jgi:hypothetical protein
MKFTCKSCQAISQLTSDYGDPSIICPVCCGSARTYAALPGKHMARRDDDDDEDDDRPRKKKTASSDSNTGAKVAGAAAGMGVGMIVVIVGALLTCCVCLPGAGVGLGWLAWIKVKNAADSVVMVNNLRQAALSNQNYLNNHQHFASPKMPGVPPSNLSWRVTILEGDLFDGKEFVKFDRNQAWDSPKNKPLMGPMPNRYLNPVKQGFDGTKTDTQVQYFTGANTAFPDPLTKLKIVDITGGTSNKFMCAEAATAVPWTKPADMVVEAQGKLPLPDGRFAAAMFDASVRVVNRANATDEILRKAINPKADQQWNEDWSN